MDIAQAPWCSRRLPAGKHVVTANKALVGCAWQLRSLPLPAPKAWSWPLRPQWPAAFPIIKALREGLTANRIEWIAGIINGTTNFILSEMRRQGPGLCVRAGKASPGAWAMPKPTRPSTSKVWTLPIRLTIMSAIAFGVPVQFDKAHVEGISASCQATDIRYAEQLGYRIKLLGHHQTAPATAGSSCVCTRRLVPSPSA